ncbi:hypothetical protein DY218_08575 [Streptomyces triticagri]|uniref:Uncharacterized protein n=1 Tax=Streptomyces triticagri TaxID=2293568 RepID=A0A372M9N3_9ACTN|nr:hypothetical protein [Streptomyces triticagri]RFU87143.1 hypothetical protein DY218_08575 [Streptomyces triticagri]
MNQHTSATLDAPSTGDPRSSAGTVHRAGTTPPDRAQETTRVRGTGRPAPQGHVPDVADLLTSDEEPMLAADRGATP